MRSLRQLKNKKIAAIAATAIVAGSAGTAYAYWTTTGAGSGSAAAVSVADADAQKVVLAQTSDLTGFYPGAPAKVIVLTASNPADFAQKVGEITVSIEPASLGSCDESNWTLVNEADNVGVVLKGAPKTNVRVGTLQLDETANNQDVCKGVQPRLAFASAGGE